MRKKWLRLATLLILVIAVTGLLGGCGYGAAAGTLIGAGIGTAIGGAIDGGYGVRRRQR